MATEVLMPKMGLTMTEGTIEEWKFKEGDTVKKGEATTVEELRVKASVNKAIMELLDKNGCLGDMPESDQVTMF